MPEISALPVAPALPPAAGVGAATPQAPRDANGAPSDAKAPSFLSQLQSALTGLGLLTPVAPTSAAPATAPTTDATDAAALPATADDADDTDTTDELPEVLAALGFVPVPAQLPLLTVVVEASPPGTSATGVSAALGSLQTVTPPVHGSVPNDAPPSEALASADPTLPTPAPTATADQAKPTTPSADALLDQMQPVTPQAQPTIDPRLLTQPQAPTQQQEHTADRKPAAIDPTSATTLAGQPLVTTPASSAQTASNSNGDSDSNDPSGDPVPASDATATRTDAPTQAFANVAHAATHRVDTSSEVKPAHVVNQIAHQGDLYRLPGGRGVRIQLHPDDLGGVGVTIKYGATGGLELHVTAEHAATAQLVQAGWNDLRDALSVQGIAPERLIMSVSGPSGADLSNSQGGSHRSDTGAASFGFGQDSSPNRDSNNNESRAGRGWGGFDDAPVASVDDVRPGSAVSNSRIDYRV